MILDLNFYCSQLHLSFVHLHRKKVIVFCCFTWLWCDFTLVIPLNISTDSPLNFFFSSLLFTLKSIEILLQPCIVSIFLDQFLYCLKILNYFKCMIFAPIMLSCIVIDARLWYNVSNWFICFLFFIYFDVIYSTPLRYLSSIYFWNSFGTCGFWKWCSL